MCFGRARSGDAGRVEEVGSEETEVRRDSAETTFAGRRTAAFAGRLDPFREPLEDTDLVAFAFKRIDLAGVDARLPGFFEVFPLVFVFVAINAATYTVTGWLKSRTQPGRPRRQVICYMSIGLR